MMTKKAQVVMLPTKETGTLHYNPHIQALRKEMMINSLPQHLYFTTDDRPKEDDWCYDGYKGAHPDTIIHKFREKCLESGCKKIVATTNKELWKKRIRDEDGAGGWSEGIGIVPTDFIEAYVREQGRIKEVLLECHPKEWTDINEYLPALKLRPNGTVIIHRAKEEKYSREQVIDILREFDAYASKELGIPVPDGGSWFIEHYNNH